MGRTLSILGIIGAVLAALAATILIDIGPVVVAAFAIGAGIYLAISKDLRRLGPGLAGILFGLLGVLGVIGSVGGEGGEVEFGISAAVGQAFVVISAMSISGASVLLTWKRLEPDWISFIWAGVWIVGSLFAIGMRGDLGDQSQPGGFVVAVFALACMGGPIMRILHRE